MRSLKGLFGLALVVVMVFGLLALVTPAEAAKPIKDNPDCKHPCQPTKKHNRVICDFVGCHPETGACMYGC
jgi:hypothetical protein